jgi:hypothetical protein
MTGATPAERTFPVTVSGLTGEDDTGVSGGNIEVTKDPDDVLDYSLDWSARLNATEHIADSQWFVPLDLTIAMGLQPFDAAMTTVWLSGGKEGRIYSITNRITTDEDRVLDQTFTIKMVIR